MIETDAKDVFVYLHEPEVNCFMSMKFDTLEDAVNELKRWSGETEFHLAIVLKETGKVIGEIEAYLEPDDDKNSDTFSPCWMLNKNYQGKGCFSWLLVY